MSDKSNPYDAPQTAAAGPAAPPAFASYEEVPWYRRSGVNSIFVLLGVFCFSPLLWIVCIVLVTGDIYYNKYREDGTLKTWSFANKVVAWLLLLVNLAVFGAFLAGWSTMVVTPGR